jgi:hypothetical protein
LHDASCGEEGNELRILISVQLWTISGERNSILLPQEMVAWVCYYWLGGQGRGNFIIAYSNVGVSIETNRYGGVLLPICMVLVLCCTVFASRAWTVRLCWTVFYADILVVSDCSTNTILWKLEWCNCPLWLHIVLISPWLTRNLSAKYIYIFINMCCREVLKAFCNIYIYFYMYINICCRRSREVLENDGSLWLLLLPRWRVLMWIPSGLEREYLMLGVSIETQSNGCGYYPFAWC